MEPEDIAQSFRILRRCQNKFDCLIFEMSRTKENGEKEMETEIILPLPTPALLIVFSLRLYPESRRDVRQTQTADWQVNEANICCRMQHSLSLN